MHSIIDILTRVRRILELVEIRQTEYNQAAIRECVALLDAVIDGMKKAVEMADKQEEQKT